MIEVMAIMPSHTPLPLTSDSLPDKSPAFPLAVYETILQHDVSGHLSWHWHEELQLCLVTAGRVTFSFGPLQIALCAGEGIFIGSGCLHMVQSLGDAPGSCLCLTFSPKLLGSFQGSTLEQTYVLPYLYAPELSFIPLRRGEDWQRQVLDQAVKIQNAYIHRRFGYEYECISLLYQIWLALLSHRPSEGGGSRAPGPDNNSLPPIPPFINTP